MHLYLHVPFCARRCSYCDFTIAVRRDVPTDGYVRAVLREWEGWQGHESWAGSDAVDTIYFGGGTPSRLDPRGISVILERVAKDRRVSPAAEVTLEANPDDVSPERAVAWAAAGVNRVSLGAQSFDPAVLAWMHRTHTADQTGGAVRLLRAAGITELSLDLIFGLPASLARNWHADLERALALRPDHLSLYGLTVEDHTPLARWTARGEVVPVDEARYAAEFLEADAALGEAGYEHYEVSNYGRPGRQARHNSAYWRRAPFIGLGPSAHSAWGRQRQWNLREWAAYERVVAAGQSPVAGSEGLDDEAVQLEELYLGLRTRDGIAGDRLPQETRDAWLSCGWASVSNGRVRLLPEGWLRVDALVAAL
ncbi:MAG TPA: radical SAM family heme chaperone HemW [Thermoanaerobaculia bacterium]|nr:radical SAM family heme chaperone HemW [Thermoanaerobaculia bacterium]